jgi:hypothetical protein
MKFHFGLHRTSQENFGGGLADRCDSTDLRKEIRLVADGMLWSWTAGTNAMYRPIPGEADITPDHVRHKITSTFDAQTDAREKNCGVISEK